MLMAAAWLQVCPLPDNTILLVSGVLYGVGCMVALAAVFFMPELPRLKREKGRTPAHHEMWVVLLFFIADGVMLFMDAYALLEQGQPLRYAAAGSALTVLAAGISVANERMCLCWNDEGFLLRTALGNLHHFRWEQLTGHHTYRGVTYLKISGRTYTANLSSRQVACFLRRSKG